LLGEGFFIKHSNVPLSLAWEAFGGKNGAASLEELRLRIEKLDLSTFQWVILWSEPAERLV
jgi:hypothetical protein